MAEVLLPHEEGKIGYNLYPQTKEVLWKHSEEVHCLSNPVSLSIPLSDPLPHLEKGIARVQPGMISARMQAE